jgi:hypothetical protein
MDANDLTKPLRPAPRKQRRGIVLPIVAGISGVLSAFVILFGAGPDRGKPLSAASVPQQPVPADSVRQQSAPSPPPVTATPKTITLTVIDSQTGAKREVVLPAPTNDQLEGDLRSTMTTTPVESVAPRPAAKSKRH